jgi:hypothetical protein
MNRSRLFLVIPVALTLGLTGAIANDVSAQAPPIRSTPPQTIGNPTGNPSARPLRFTKPRNSRAVTASGCLQLERAVASRPDVIAGGGGDSDGYVITGAKLKGLGVTSGGEDAAAELYRVSGLAEAKFREHLNQRVEIKGRLHLGVTSSPEETDEKSSGSASSGGANGDAKNGDASTSDAKGLPAITATSIKMLESTCAAGSN